MTHAKPNVSPTDLVREFEKKYFWWVHVGTQPRSDDRVLAQAMELGSVADINRLESLIGPVRLVEVMHNAQPGWFTERPWEFWRDRLFAATGKTIAEKPPKRNFLP